MIQRERRKGRTSILEAMIDVRCAINTQTRVTYNQLAILVVYLPLLGSLSKRPNFSAQLSRNPCCHLLGTQGARLGYPPLLRTRIEYHLGIPGSLGR